MRDVDDDVLVRPDVARAARRHDDSHHAAGAVGGGGGGYAGGMLLESSREAQIGGSARALLERPVGPPVHCDRSGGPAEREEVGIAAGVGGEVQLLAANTSGNPNFFTFGGPPGSITVDWRANGAFQQRSSGTSAPSFAGGF